MAGVTIDSGEIKMLRDIDVKHQPSRSKVLSGWITALRDGNAALSAVGPILGEIEHYRMWELDYGDPKQLLEVIGVYKFADTLDGVPQLLDEYVRRLVDGRSAKDVSDRVQAVAAARANKLAGHGAPKGNRNAVKASSRIEAECRAARESKLENKGNGPDNINSVSEPKGGTGKTYTLRRLARDRPDLLDRVEAGELSANAAAIEAGFRSKPSPADVVAKMLPKLSREELERVADMIEALIDA